MTTLTKRLSIRADKQLDRALAKAAERSGRTKPAFIRHVLKVALGIIRLK